ncbi:MAG: ATP-binding cassette domain-containing protein [Chlorobi bacterium]|nr:ATP-binding cassette domain-containing protein [Chlorobiota bacterium]
MPHFHNNNIIEPEKKKVTTQNLKKLLKLFRFVKPQFRPFIIGLFFLLLSSLTNLIFPALMGELLDSAQNKVVSEINRIAIFLLLIFFANAIFSYFRIYLFAKVTQKTLALLRQTTYNHLIQLPMSFFTGRRVGELNSRISSDISLLQETFTSTLAQFIRQVIIIIGGIILLTVISPRLTIFMLALVPIVFVLARYFGKYVRKYSRKTQDKIADSNIIVEETLTGINNVKAFANEFYEMTRYKKSTNEVVDIALQGARWRGAFASFIIFALFGSIVGVIWYGVYLVNQGAGMSSGDLFKFILYSVFVGSSIGGIADLYSQIQKALGATENLLTILEEKKEMLNGQTKENNIAFGKIKFDSVSFYYPSRDKLHVLRNINFEIKQGEQVALVGPSGAGKSTITNLLLRFYEPVEGIIKIDDKTATSYSLHELRNNISIVPQEVLLFGGSIKENIAYGNPYASDNEILEAAKKANAMQFIEEFPDKMETLVGERGVQLSGGQRQRIAIARAILKNPKILILDEATSSLDSESEKLVQQALVVLMKNRTSLVIAHRLSTIRNADRILVIDKGEIKEAGTHTELMQIKNGIYKNLNQLQLSSIL